MTVLRAALLATLWLVHASGVVSAQERTQPLESGLEETAEVRMALLDVIVVGRDGKPVTGLTPDNFEVRVDRKRRGIESFDAWRPVAASLSVSGPDRMKPSAAAEEQQPAQGGPERNDDDAAADPGGESPGGPAGVSGEGVPHEDAVPAADASATGEDAASGTAGLSATQTWSFIVFDVDRLSPQYRERALSASLNVVREAASLGGRVAIGVLEDGDLRLLQPFSPAESVPPGLLSDASVLLGKTDPMSSRIEEAVEYVYQCASSSDPESCTLRSTGEFRDSIERENREAIRALRSLVNALAPIPGRKALFVLSDGMLLEPGELVAEASRQASGGVERILSLLSSNAPAEYNALLAEASAARVSMFMLRTGTPVETASYSVRRAPDALRGASERQRPPMTLAGRLMESSLMTAARRTGGEVVLKPLDRRATSDLLGQLAGGYTLGIPIKEGDRRDSRIRVRLVGVKGTVRAPETLAPSALPSRELPGSLELVPRVEEGQRPRIEARVLMELDTLAVEGGGEESSVATSRVALFIRLLDESGKQLAQHYTLLAVPRAPGEPQYFVHPMALMVEPGTFIVDVAATDVLGRGSFRRSERVVVPAQASALAD